jgi:ABC-type polysaccharide/polyol phosphate transport system ATPase subunit
LGLNGAGKSTLLKTIAGIYHPHEGRVVVCGRITPLMELGAGFDVEQTGRENIYLNGAMLGFPPSEMKKREPAIAEFSELKEFLDLPVKYYSSGMYGRLAFSIATMTDPQVLLIDEVFATGDAHFVEKSSRRILDLVERSKVVLIVSHSTDQIQKLCNRVIVLNKGKIVNDGKPSEMIDFYVRTLVHSQ